MSGKKRTCRWVPLSRNLRKIINRMIGEYGGRYQNLRKIINRMIGEYGGRYLFVIFRVKGGDNSREGGYPSCKGCWYVLCYLLFLSLFHIVAVSFGYIYK